MFKSPSWGRQLKGPMEQYDKEEHGVVGDVDLAIRQLVGDLIEGKRSYYDILCRWDSTRGNDWYTQTQKDLFGSHEEYEVEGQ